MLSKDIEELKYQFEGLNFATVYKKVEKIKKTEQYQLSPIIDKLYLNYFQIFPLTFLIFSLPDDMNDVFDQFLEISYDEIQDAKIQLFYLSIQIIIYDFRNKNDLVDQLKNKVINEIFNSLNLSSTNDKELLFFLGLILS